MGGANGFHFDSYLATTRLSSSNTNNDREGNLANLGMIVAGVLRTVNAPESGKASDGFGIVSAINNTIDLVTKYRGGEEFSQQDYAVIGETVAIYAGVFSKNPYIKGMERAFALSTLSLSNKANANSTEIPPPIQGNDGTNSSDSGSSSDNSSNPNTPPPKPLDPPLTPIFQIKLPNGDVVYTDSS